jgi:prepilin-type N-terminal cleavage/methylation domain-containing protein
MNELIKKAFTLIELLVVIAIIGILSGLIVVSMGGVTQKANIAKAQVFSNSLKNAFNDEFSF